MSSILAGNTKLKALKLYDLKEKKPQLMRFLFLKCYFKNYSFLDTLCPLICLCLPAFFDDSTGSQQYKLKVEKMGELLLIDIDLLVQVL